MDAMRLICELEWLYEPEPPGMPIHKERQKQPEPSEPFAAFLGKVEHSENIRRAGGKWSASHL